MKNFVKQGNVMTFTAPSGGVTSGLPVLIGSMFLVPAYDAADGEECEGSTVGVFELPKKPTDAPAQFTPAYWDNTNNHVTTIASSNKKIGIFGKDYVNGDELAQVRLDGISSGNKDGKIILSGERLKLVAAGDSLTDIGDSPATPSYSKSTRGYWVNAIISSKQEFELLAGLGVSGDTTQDLIDRIDDVIASKAEIVMLLIGTNDINQGVPINTIESNMSSILSSIISSGKKVCLVPVPHRQISDNFNSEIDELNIRYKNLASTFPNDVVFSRESLKFNERVSKKTTELDVTTDGLHPNSYGAWLIGKDVAITLNERFKSKSPIGRVNKCTAFNGSSGGLLLNGATGEVPLDWRLYYANPANGFGGVINEDKSYTIKTGVSTGNNENKSLFRSGNVPIEKNEKYIFIIDITMLDTANVTAFSLTLTGKGVQSSFKLNLPTTGGAGESIGYDSNSIETLPMSFEDAEYLNIFLTVTSDPSKQIEYTLANPRLYKV